MSSPGTTNPRGEILIVEDSPTQAEQLQYVLEESGYRVRAAKNGAEALAMAEAGKPTLVISDVVMPGMDGFELCRRVKSRARLQETPVILLTSLTSAHDVIRGLECGADNFIRKPFEAQELLARIDYILTNMHVRAHTKMRAGVEIAFGGQKYFITAERQQILDLLITTYEDAVFLNEQLAHRQAEIARNNQLLQGLFRIAETLNQCIEVRDVLEKSLELALELPGVQAGWVSLREGKRKFRLAASRNLPAALESPAAFEGDCLCRRKLLSGEFDRVMNRVECERLQNAGGDTRGLRYHASIPLRISDRILGLLNLAGSGDGFFQEEDEKLLGSLGNQVAVALERSQLLEELEKRVDERTAALKAEIAEHKRTEEKLRQSEEQFRLISENVADLIAVLDLNGRRVYNSPSYKNILGDPEEFRGTDSFNEIHPEDRDRIKAIFEETVRTGVGQRAEYRFVIQDGSIRFIESQGSVIRGTEGKPANVVVVSRDVTERKNLEQQLLQSQKMEAVGQLAGGVAHDFNNLLTIINGYSQMLLDGLGADKPGRSGLEEIRKAGDRAASLTRQLLAFSRRQVLAPQVLDLNAAVADISTMLQRLIGDNIQLATVQCVGLGRVKADPAQIGQVIMNLAVNARDAMPHGGKLTIETSNVNLDESYARSHAGVKPGPYAMLAVSDTGIGMDTETRSHIFEPFFTTKGKKGTGLGLATVYGIVKQSGGNIWVYSEPGRGTTFKVYLPSVEEEMVTSYSGARRAHSVAGSETILLVEDEEALRALVRKVLESNGYKVLEARSGEDAAAVSERHQGPIQLLLTDVVMPAMSGRELAEHLASSHREMRVLYMSGYTDNAIVHHGVLEPGAAFLQKPFNPGTLLERVREVLDSGPSEGSQLAA